MYSTVNIFGEHKRSGAWRLPRVMRLINVFGACKLDLREATISQEAMTDGVIEINGFTVFGELKIIVPEGVDVEINGAVIFSARKLNLGPAPRRPGAPLIRIRVHTVFGEVSVRSEKSGISAQIPKWILELLPASVRATLPPT